MSKQFISNIVVAINGSHSSILAAMYAIMMAKHYGCTVHFIYVVDVATIDFLKKCNFLISDERNSYQEELTQNGKNYLSYVEGLAKSKLVLCKTQLRQGSVPFEIISCADEIEADLIILGGHESKDKYVQKDNVRKSILSNSRTEIITYAHCPVLVIHDKNIEAQFKVLK
ncbi:MAG: universal stress protein [Treponema sp.]|nr:universal stress protein [Treponema sp.]